MITKAVIRALAREGSNYFRVYIPLLRTAADDEEDAIFNATLCSISGIKYDLKVGDVVFVGFEDNYYDKPVILGKLFLNKDEEITTQITVKTLKVTDKSQLSKDTSIGSFDSNKLNIALKDIIEDKKLN